MYECFSNTDVHMTDRQRIIQIKKMDADGVFHCRLLSYVKNLAVDRDKNKCTTIHSKYFTTPPKTILDSSCSRSEKGGEKNVSYEIRNE